MVSVLAFVAVAVAAERPWYMSAASQSFVDFALAARRTDIPVSSMSSVARELAEGALAPPGFTTLAKQAVDLYVADGPKPNPTSLYDIATGLSSVHESIKTDPVYSEYVSYARNAASNFDGQMVSSLLASRPTTTVDPRLQEVHTEANRRARAEYSSILADPSGRAAVSEFRNVGREFISDFDGNAYVSVILNSFIQRIANLV